MNSVSLVGMKKRSTSRRSAIMTVEQFRVRFGDERQCGEQLSRQRWFNGFKCPRCGGPGCGYIAARRVHECAVCAYQCSVTAGTIFHKTRTPLVSWFWAIYRMSHDKKGISAMQLAKEIGVSYPTAWLMLHKIRKAMSDRDQRYRLSGLVEVDRSMRVMLAASNTAKAGESRRGRGRRGVRGTGSVGR